MKYFPLEPVEAQLTDPATGIVYTLTAEPPTEEDLNDLFSMRIADYALDMTPKEFVQTQCWRILRVPHLEQMRSDNQDHQEMVREILPLLIFGVDAITVDTPTVDEGAVKSYYNVSYGQLSKYSPTPGIDQPPSVTLCEEIARRVSRSPVVEELIITYLGHMNPDLVDSVLGEESDGDTTDDSLDGLLEKKTSLFPNSGRHKDHIAVPKLVTDGFGSLGGITRTLIKTQQDEANDYEPQAKVRIDGQKKKLSDGTVGQRWVELNVDEDSLATRTAEECAKELLRIKKPAELQCFLALWELAAQQDSARFKDMPLSQLMKLILKDDNPNKKARQRFTDMLHWLSRVKISVSRIVEEQKGKGKPRIVLKVVPNVRIFEFGEVTYSVRQPYRHLPKELLTDEHFDKSVITKFSGGLLPLPEHAFMFEERANVYKNILLSVDANKDGQVINVGFAIQTRFNQNQDKSLPAVMLRSQLIDLCDYEQTNARQASKATGYLAKVFDKLKEAGIIARYEGLTNVDTDRVSFYPPAPTPLPAG